MKRLLTLLSIIFIGIGFYLLINGFSSQRIPQQTKPVEITREATTSALPSGKEQKEAVVKRVIDGDTIELATGERVRYIGIDTPEIVHPQKPMECFGVEAKEENRKLALGKRVRLEKDVSETDQYGRLLRYVYVGDTMVNDVLVRQGFAYAVTFPPDVAYQEQFRQAQLEARENNRGLWAGCPLGATNATNTPSLTPGVGQSSCTIKGNISTSGERIYHIPGCGSYDKTVIDETAQERWFCTEEEARAAGWRKAKNCP